MRFGDPVYFNLLWLVILLLVFLVWSARKKADTIARFCSRELIPKLINPETRRIQRNKSILIILGIVFLILAMTQPRWGYQWEELHQEGVDIVVALDVSNSMLAEDIKPFRLERAKRKIADLLQMLEGDRVGLVAFAGTAFVQCPLTLDYSAARIFLDAIGTDLIPVQGTALGQAIRTSVKAFRTEEKKSKAIILITDGEDQTGDAIAAAELAREQGVKIYTIGIGRETGAPIPNPDATGGFKKDERGQVILTKLDETTLQKIALATGGSYVRSVTGDMDLEKIYLDNIKQKIEKKELRSQRRKIWQERFQWLVFFALICLSMEVLMAERKPPGAAVPRDKIRPNSPEL